MVPVKGKKRSFPNAYGQIGLIFWIGKNDIKVLRKHISFLVYICLIK